MSKENRIAIVTGAGSGIGRAVSISLYNDGWSVVIAGRRKEPLLETAKGRDPNRILAAPADVTSADSVEGLFRQTIEKFGRLDLLFNNAGIGAPAKPMEDLTLAEWQKVVDTNLTGVFLCTREAMRIMKTQKPAGGRIINNGSISAHVPRPLSAPYTATKHAITGLTKSTSLDGRPFHITCGQIDIGNAASEMTSRMAAGALQPDGSTKPEPTMDAMDVGRAIVFMANLPRDTNVPFLTVMANEMPYMGRG